MTPWPWEKFLPRAYGVRVDRADHVPGRVELWVRPPGSRYDDCLLFEHWIPLITDHVRPNYLIVQDADVWNRTIARSPVLRSEEGEERNE